MKGSLWRREYLKFKGYSDRWLLVYGRRKTGKTYLVKLLESPSLYATVTRDLSVIVEEKEMDPVIVDVEDAVKKALEILRNEGIVVFDEFQRLPYRYWQMLSQAHPRGRLVLVASSLSIISKVFDEGSPLLGLVTPFRIGIIHIDDVIVSLVPRVGPRASVLWSPILMEPWTYPMAPRDLEYTMPWEFIARNIEGLTQIAAGLVGEVFEEEERHLTKLYRAVLMLLGRGVWRSDEISGLLYKRGLLATPSPGPVTGILDRMSALGLVNKTKLWKTRRYRVYYRHESPLLGILYGLMARLGAGETPLPEKIIERVARELYAREIQFALGSLLAELYEGIQAYAILPDSRGDIDIVILDHRGKKPLVVYEVKMGSCSRHDIRLAKQRAVMVGAPRAGLICLGKREIDASEDVEILDSEKIAEIAYQVVKRKIRIYLG